MYLLSCSERVNTANIIHYYRVQMCRLHALSYLLKQARNSLVLDEMILLKRVRNSQVLFE